MLWFMAQLDRASLDDFGTEGLTTRWMPNMDVLFSVDAAMGIIIESFFLPRKSRVGPTSR